MAQLQEDFLSELKSQKKLALTKYAALYDKYSKLAIEQEEKNGASKPQAKAMGEYYTVTTLSNFIANEHTLTRIITLRESYK